MQMLIMIKKQLKLLFRNRIAILATISVPLILTYLFSFSMNSSSTEKLYIADSDKSVYSKQLVDTLKQHKDITVVNTTEADIKKKVDDQEISLGLVINKNFGEDLLSGNTLDIKLLQNYENGDSAVLEQIISGDVSTFKKVVQDSKYISSELNSDNYKLSSQILGDIKNSSNISVADRSLNSGQKTQDEATLRLIGFLVMFIWFVVIQGFRTLIDEKENSTFNRLLSTPTKYSNYLLSKIIATYIFGALHIAAILIAGKYFLKVSIVDNLLSVSLIFAAYLLVLTSITSIIVLFIKKQQNFTVTSSIIITVTGLLGGSFFSMEIAPSYIQTISKFTPEAWAIQALKDVMFNNSALTLEVLPLSIFVGIGVLGLIVSSSLVNSKIKFKSV
ncbi:MAG: ABC transporter permease [Bacillota bacterium]|nr:ABC transporter permease [Bacillota bacterium]